MERSRIIIYIGCALGLVATALPWVTAGPFTATGLDGPDGMLNIAIFGVPALLNVLGERSKPNPVALSIGIMALGLVAFSWSFWRLAIVFEHARLSPGVGVYVMLVGSVLIIGHRLLVELNPDDRAE